MSRLDCISILEAGSFGADSGTVVIPTGENTFPNHINIYSAVGTASGIGTAVGVAPGNAGIAAGVGTAAGVGADAAAAAAHRYWRVNITAASGGVCSVAEVEFWLNTTTKHTTSGGTVIASGTGAGAAADVFDGNLSTWWYSGGGTGWIGYDFGSGNDKVVSMVAICGRDNSQYPTVWSLDYSDNGSSWTTLFGGTNNPSTMLGRSKLYYFTDPAAGYQHTRCRWTTDSSGAVRLSAIQMRTSVGGADTSSTAFAKVSWNDTVGTVANLFDGNAATEWAATLFPASVHVYFPDNRVIAQVALQAPGASDISQAPDELYIDTSPDGITWTNVFAQTGFSAWSTNETRTYNI